MGNGPFALVGALILALGIAVAGWLVGDGFARGRAVDRYVTVKGVSERTVTADLAVWPLRFVATGDNLAATQAELGAAALKVRRFLTAAGVAEGEIEMQRLEVNDLQANPYRSGPITNRYIIAQTLVVRSSDVARTVELSQRVGELVDAGVVLGGDAAPSPGPFYLFTKLNDLKPEMIAEATKRAREGAERFAADSASRLAGIRRANQGVFEILPRNDTPGMSEETQVEKTVRVVSTIEYRLED
jgi:hypothetical protein